MRISNRYILIICIAVVLFVAAACAYLFFFHTKPAATFSCSSLTIKPTIVAFGDSLVAGYGAPDQQGFVTPLSTQIGTTIINEGVSGDTTGQALKRLPDVLAKHPDIVIVLLGGNDALQQLPQSTTQANLEQILSILQRNHIRIVLVGVLGGFPGDPYAPMFQQLAKAYDAYYVPNILAGLIGNKQYMYDEVHPNAAGYDKAAARIYPDLNQACSAFAQS